MQYFCFMYMEENPSEIGDMVQISAVSVLRRQGEQTKEWAKHP